MKKTLINQALKNAVGSFRHSHFYTLHSRLRYCFTAYTTLPYPMYFYIA